MVKPCYRVCVWVGGRWRPWVTRTRSLLRTLRALHYQGWGRHQVWVERRPGKFIPLPPPATPGPAGLRIYHATPGR